MAAGLQNDDMLRIYIILCISSYLSSAQLTLSGTCMHGLLLCPIGVYVGELQTSSYRHMYLFFSVYENIEAFIH